ncbi:Hypothetical predicted protein [Mytilus galloprovincialis]|uniref:ABC transmembrane type-1 domain-containing protein n=1 Tax=Mytilus galloprovincialis TaxID=29158 RepID=A0A8B6CGA7_MYTGA|nr:Hypothetical predicted protein [Mytilus galloprovincialis]
MEMYNENLKHANRQAFRKGIATGLGLSVFWFFIYSAFAVAFWYGIYLIRNGEAGFEPGKTLTIFMGVMIGAMSLGQAFPTLEVIGNARGAAEKVFEIIEQKSEIDFSSKEGGILEKVEGNISFKNLYFTYPARPDVQVLRGLSLDIRKGQTVALVGSSGCGKSTGIQLLQRFYNPEKGEKTIFWIQVLLLLYYILINMPGGNSLTSNKSVNKSGKCGNTVQTLLAAKLDKVDKEKTEKPNKQPKRTHSEVSNESNTSVDLTGIISIQRDIEEIKQNLEGGLKKIDLENATKDLVKSSDLEVIVTTIVKNLFKEFTSSIETKIDKKVSEVIEEMQEKIDALSIENENLREKAEVAMKSLSATKKELHQNERLTEKAITSSNYNEQYSRKNNIRVINFPWRERQDLRADFISKVKRDMNVELEERDVVAIHRIPSDKLGPKPLIVRLFSSDVKRRVMREKKNLQDHVRFYDDISKRNIELMKRLNETEWFSDVWYFNCGVYGRISDGLQLKFNIFDDIFLRLRQRK